MKNLGRHVRTGAVAIATGISVLFLYTATGAQGQGAPRYKFDPDFPKPLPNKWKIISDMANSHVWFLNRADGKVLGNFGTMRDQGGLFYGLHMVEVDSRNYIYTGEVFAGERIQRFVPSDSARGTLLEQLSALPYAR